MMYLAVPLCVVRFACQIDDRFHRRQDIVMLIAFQQIEMSLDLRIELCRHRDTNDYTTRNTDCATLAYRTSIANVHDHRSLVN